MTDGGVVDTEKEGNKTKERQSGERGKQKEIDCSGDGVEKGERKDNGREKEKAKTGKLQWIVRRKGKQKKRKMMKGEEC